MEPLPQALIPPREIHARLNAARRASARLAQRPIDEILQRIETCVEHWLDPGFLLRRQAEEQLPSVTGFSREMIRHGLPLQFEPLRAAEIARLLDAELGSRHTLDRHPPGRATRTPGLIGHILAGNIPGLAAAPIFLSLALKAAVLVKPAAGDPLTAMLIRESIAQVDPSLADCVCVASWRGGDEAVEAVALQEPDVVVASGSDAAIAAIAARVRGRFIGHGHRVSVALIGRESLASSDSAREAAQQLGYDVTLWDQQGCLSPQMCYVEAGPGEADRFAALLGEALQELAARLPPRRRSFEEEADVQRFRQQAEWEPGRRLLASSDSTAWSIAVEDDPAFLPSCLNRCLRLKPIADLRQAIDLITRHRGLVEAAGVAAALQPDASLRAALLSAGVHHVCALGTMQTPTLAWRPGGRPRVADWFPLDREEAGAGPVSGSTAP